MVGAAAAIALLVAATPPLRAQILDSFVENFESYPPSSSIDGAEFWAVTQGAAASAMVQSAVTPGGTGKALELIGSSNPVAVSRPTAYGNLSPTWIRFLIRPGLGGETQPAPSQGVAAVTFDFGGQVLAADGTAWVDTGSSFTPGSWLEVVYKLNFSSHTYDVFLRPSGATTALTPAKSGLRFIDPSKSSMTSLTIGGAYSATQTDDTYVDDVTVTYIERIEFVTAAQTLVHDQTSEPITIQLQNSLLEPQRAVTDVLLELRTTSQGGEFSLADDPWKAIGSLILPQDASTATFYYRDSQIGRPTISVKEYPDSGWLEGLQQQRIIYGDPFFDVQATGAQTAGVPFTVTILAKDEEGDVDGAYNGLVKLETVYLDPATGVKDVSPAQSNGFVNGRLDVQVTYADAGTIGIRVTDVDDSSRTGESGPVSLLPDHLEVVANPVQIVGLAFPLTVRAVTSGGALTPNYQGDLTLGVTPAQGMPGGFITPATVPASAFNDGAATVQALYPSWGEVAISATDTANGSLTGESGPVMFHPESLRIDLTPPPPPRDFYYLQEPFTLSVTLLATGGEPLSSYQGRVELTASTELGLPQYYVFTDDDSGTHAFEASAGTAGTYTIAVSEPDAALVSPTEEVLVKEAILQIPSTNAPVGGTAEIPITLVDEDGNVIESENSLTIVIEFDEERPNRSVGSSALNQRITLVNGRATVVLTNFEEESVGISASAPFGLRTQAGTVKFGHFATKGVGFLMWREITEQEPNR
ncbi:MAG TPA: DUF6701 domain-containing protein [bacterium]